MSVIDSIQMLKSLHLLKNDTRDIIHQLNTYRALALQFNNTVSTTIQTYAQRYYNSIEQMKNTIETLQQKLHHLSEDNSRLRTQYMSVVVENQQFKEKIAKAYQENLQKQSRVKQLVIEVEGIRKYMKQLEDLKQSEQVVNFDDGEAIQRFDTLQTINEVSEHDLSVSMSIESLKSYQFDEFTPTRNKNPEQSMSLSMTPKIQSYEVENYQDALSILKNYTSGAGLSMLRTNKIDVSQAKENIPMVIDSNLPDCLESKPPKNCTMDKIKKMRRIQTLQLESGYVVKSDKKPFAVRQNGQESQQSIKESKIEHRDGFGSRNSYAPNSGRSSIESTRVRSQQIVSLQQQIKCVINNLEKINTIMNGSYQLVKARPTLCNIQYSERLHYHGSCDSKDLPSSFGKLSINNEIIYQGEWRAGKMHGWGKLVMLPFVNGRQRKIIEVDGNFRNGVIEGTVVCVFNTGQKFMGIIKNGSIEHQGTFVSEKGILTGHWEDSCLVLLI